MTWIKPNFLRMMYRSGWGAKPGQDVILAIHLHRSTFDSILAEAMHSSFQSGLYENQEVWQKAVQASDVRLQWDPDHHPAGNRLERRAIQLGLWGETIRQYAQEWIIDIEDISDFVAEQWQNAASGNYEALLTPAEAPYPVLDLETARRLQVPQIFPTSC